MIILKAFIVLCLLVAVIIPFLLLVTALVFISKSRRLNGMVLQIDKYGAIQNIDFKSKRLFISNQLEAKYSKFDIINNQFLVIQKIKKYAKYALLIEVVAIVIVSFTIFD
jgi:hypothetical protein